MRYVKTTATKKLLKLRKRIRAVSGGTAASKTISILMWLISYCETVGGDLVSVISESFPHLKRGAIRDFMSIMENHGHFEPKRWNKTDYIYTFPNKSKMEFFSADQPGKVRGPRRDVMFINEANNIPLETFRQLDVRTRKTVWMDWNPVNEFWWYTDIAPHTPHDFITLTYKDNEALSPEVVSALEKYKHNKSWWKVYGEGQLGELENQIYRDWAVLDEVPHEARLERYGLDFGYTNDPTTIDAIYYYNGGYIIDEITHQKGLSNKQIADILNNQERKALTIADSAEPKSIDEISSYGVSILPSVKGRDSVLSGIQYVQDQRISVTKRSINVIKEQRNYLWQMDKDERIINEPCKAFDHHMDGIRYAIVSLRGNEGDVVLPDDTAQFQGKWI